jgi:hypothetical protein
MSQFSIQPNNRAIRKILYQADAFVVALRSHSQTFNSPVL